MSTFDYNEIVADVISLIKEFGSEYARRKNENFDQSVMHNEPIIATDVVKGVKVLENVKIDGVYMKKNVVYLDPSKTIDKLDELLIEGNWTNLKELEIIKPAETLLLYKLILEQ